MATVAKTILATGASSGLGFEAVKQLLAEAQPYHLIIGARDVAGTQARLRDVNYDASKHNLTVLPLELNNLTNVQGFAKDALAQLGAKRLDYVMLCAAISNGAQQPGSHGSKWCEAYIVNHLSQHYLTHLLREKIVASKSRLVVVSSGAIRGVPDTSKLDEEMKDGSGADSKTIYCDTKFTQLLGAQWWRRHLGDKATVVATSPGMVPGTGLGRGNGMTVGMNSADAISVEQGATNIIRAFHCDDLPEDPEQIFLTSWGEWWPKSVYENSLDTALQDKWSPSKEEIEAQEGLSAA